VLAPPLPTMMPCLRKHAAAVVCCEPDVAPHAANPRVADSKHAAIAEQLVPILGVHSFIGLCQRLGYTKSVWPAGHTNRFFTVVPCCLWHG